MHKIITSLSSTKYKEKKIQNLTLASKYESVFHKHYLLNHPPIIPSSQPPKCDMPYISPMHAILEIYFILEK